MFLFKNSTEIERLSIEFERKRTFLYFSKIQRKKIYVCLLNQESSDFIFREGIIKGVVNGKEKGEKKELLGGYFVFDDLKEYDINSIYAFSLKKFSREEMSKRDIATCVFRNNGEDELLISSRDLKPNDLNKSMWGNFGESLKYNTKLYETIFNVESDLIDLEKAEILIDEADALSDYNESIEISNKVLKIYPKNVKALHNKGNALLNLGRCHEAIEVYSKVLKIDPKNVNVLNNKANALFNLNKYQEAVAVLDEALEIDPKNINVLNNKVIALDELSKK